MTVLTKTRTPEFDAHYRALKWRQGEHVFLSGSTKAGKTTLARRLLDKRQFVIAFCIKPHDSTVTEDFSDYNFVDSLRDVEGWMRHVMIWPRIKKGSGEAWVAHQRAVLSHTFDKMIQAKGWTLFIDEVNYLSNPKFGGVGKQVELLHYVGRSSGLSLMTAAQRPAYVPLAILSNASHAYIARTRLASDLKRLADFGDIDQKATAAQIRALPSRHDFLYLPTQGDGTSAVINTAR